MAYVVLFEISDRFSRSKFLDAVKDMGEWAELTSQSCLVVTSDDVRSIMERLQPLLGPNDNLWVLTAQVPWSGYGDSGVDDYLHTQLGEAIDYVPKDWDVAGGKRL